MAGIMDEYDAATPVTKTYCARMTAEEYENQASTCTEDALDSLIQYLEKNPESFKRVLGRRKREEEESAGLFSFAKVKLLSLFSGKDYEDVTDEECGREVSKVATDMVKVFDYSEESRGRRCSKRLAARKLQTRERTPQTHLSHSRVKGPTVPAPPPPPPPPPPAHPTPPPPPSYPSSCITPLSVATLSRRPLSVRQPNDPVRSCPRSLKPHPLKPSPMILRSAKQQRVELLKSEAHVTAAVKDTEKGCKTFQDILHELNGPGKKWQLRSTIPRSPGGTPISGWPKQPQSDDQNLGYFNIRLLDKFKNVRSPLSSLATPGTFESPVSPTESP